MIYSILIILTSLLAASDIKIACEEHLFHLYPENTDIRMHILKLDKQMKKEIENRVKQKYLEQTCMEVTKSYNYRYI